MAQRTPTRHPEVARVSQMITIVFRPLLNGDPSPNQVTSFESQSIHAIQELSKQTLGSEDDCSQLQIGPPGVCTAGCLIAKFRILDRIPVRFERLPSLSSRGRACPGHLDC
jgi:hypothetical protein